MPESSFGQALKEGAQQSRAARRAQERKEKKERKKKGREKGRDDAVNKIRSNLTEAVENIAEIMGENNLTDQGSFLEEAIVQMAEGADGAEALAQMLDQASLGRSNDDKIDVTPQMKDLMSHSFRPLQIMLDHLEDPVSSVYLSPSKCTTRELLEFLRKHKLVPTPEPSKDVLVELTDNMVNFALACGQCINDMPDSDQSAAIGRQSMGRATKMDKDIVEKMNAPVKRIRVVSEANPQIPIGFRMDNIPQWIPTRMPKFQQCFDMLRGEWRLRQGPPISLIDEVYQTLENIARVFDFMVDNPGKDMLATIQIFPDTESEQALAVRPLAASINGYCQIANGASLPVPIIAVEWHDIRKVDNSIRKTREFMAGLRQGTLFQGIEPRDLEEFELLVNLLRANGDALDVQNEVGLLKKHCTDKGWKLSVICPADPQNKGGLLKNMCLVCDKPGGKFCNRCGVATYCSRDCQVAHWKIHKKLCKPMK